MDRSEQLQILAEVERHVARGAQHIIDQESRVAALDLSGYDSGFARDLLETFRLIQIQHVAHRDRILKELNR